MPNPLYDDGVLIVGPHTADQFDNQGVGYNHVLTFTTVLVKGALVISEDGDPICGPIAADLDVREVQQLHEALGEWLQERGRA